MGLPRCVAVADGTQDCNCCQVSCRAHLCCTCHLCCHTTSKMRLYPHPLGRPTYLTPAVSGSPTAAERGTKSEVAHKVRKLATSPLPYRGAPPLQSGGQNQKWPTKWANWLPHPCRIREPHRCRAGDKIRSGPQSGQIGYLTPAVSGSPTAAERGTKSEVAHKVGKLATSPLPYRGAPPLQSGGQNQKWPTKWANWLPHPCRIGEPHRCRAGDKIRSGPQSGQIGYLTPAVSGSPTAAERGTKSEVAHKWANWLPHPCRIGEPHRCRAGDKIRSGPQVGKLATSPLPYRGAPPLQSGGQNQKWPTKWANWLPHPCRIGEPLRFKAGD